MQRGEKVKKTPQSTPTGADFAPVHRHCRGAIPEHTKAFRTHKISRFHMIEVHSICYVRILESDLMITSLTCVVHQYRHLVHNYSANSLPSL
jgi:hypothetical protein